MREIKFRAFVNGEMLTADVLAFEEYGLLQDQLASEPCLMQYTGLKDSEGTDIFEGDVIDFTYWWFDGNVAESHLTGTVVYSDENMSFQLKGVKNKEWEKFIGYHNDFDYLTPFSELNFEEADFEVIGNIYQHPELLK